MQNIPIGVSGKPALEVAREAALAAGEIMVRRFNQSKKISYKAMDQIVTDVDTECEAAVFAILSREFPDHILVGEESSADVRADKGYAWVVDPLDGTRNYALGIPFYSTVVGLAYDGEVIVGITYDPVRDDMFEAERGKGAFLNGERIHVTEKTGVRGCVLGVDLPYNNVGAKNALEVLASIWPDMQTTRIMGSSALGLSYAAAGRTDLYFHHQLSPWDQVAGMLHVEEAGGVVTDRTGKRATLYSDGIIASNRKVVTDFLHRTEGMAWRQSTHKLV